jgi:arylsulfatase A-like enzyme
MIHRRRFLKLAGLSAAGLGGIFCKKNISQTGSKPNIILIFIDDLGYSDFSCYGNKDVHTKNIDRLATEGIKFTQFYVNSPICSPSRIAITTGQYPQRFKINSYLASREKNNKREMADFLDPEAPTIAKFLKGNGYATAHFGKWHMGGGRDVDNAPFPSAYGFDESLVSFEGLGNRILPPGGLSKQSENLGQGNIQWVEKHEMTGIYVDHAIQFIQKNSDKPFYLNLWPNDVHDAHIPKPHLLEKYNKFSYNPYQQKFYAVLDNLDVEIGRLLDFLNASNLEKKTLIILTSDNGPTDWPKYYKEDFEPPGSCGSFFGRKWSLYEGGIRMPFIARWKGKIPENSKNKQTVMAAFDLFPTICRLSGTPFPKHIQFDGEDLSEALLGQEIIRKKDIFWEYGRTPLHLRPGNPEFISPNLAIRSGDWKLLINDNGSEAKLFNLQEDISESNNLTERYPERAKKLSKKVLKWRRSLP